MLYIIETIEVGCVAAVISGAVVVDLVGGGVFGAAGAVAGGVIGLVGARYLVRGKNSFFLEWIFLFILGDKVKRPDYHYCAYVFYNRVSPQKWYITFAVTQDTVYSKVIQTRQWILFVNIIIHV